MKKLVLILNILFFNFCTSQSQGYKIKIEITGGENKDLWLAYYFEDQYITVNQITLDSKGTGTFEGDKKLDGGIYFIALADKGPCDMLIEDDQDFSLSTDTTDLILNMKVKGSEENTEFYVYQRKVVELNLKKEELESEKSGLTDSIQINKLDIDISLINNELNGLWKIFTEKNKASFFAVLLNAMHTFEVSEGEDPFSYVDFTDDRLIRTPFFYNIIRYHIAQYIEESTSIIIEENNKLLKKCTNDTVYQYVATYLLNFYRTFTKMGMNEVFVDLADNYFLNEKSNWLDSAAIEIITKQADIFRASNIGEEAYKFKVYSNSGDSINVLDFNSTFKFIFFWSIGCGHCEKAAKILKDNYDKIKLLDIEIIGVNTDGKDIESWKKYITEQEIPWTNGIDIEQKSRYKEYYYVAGTPLMYVIDKQGKIVNKMNGEEQIDAYIKYITKQE